MEITNSVQKFIALYAVFAEDHEKAGKIFYLPCKIYAVEYLINIHNKLYNQRYS